jgi:hypothetical protein
MKRATLEWLLVVTAIVLMVVVAWAIAYVGLMGSA